MFQKVVLLAALYGGLLPLLAEAEVQRSAEDGFLSVHSLNIAAPPKVVYRAMTREISRWWNPAHSYSGDARNFRLVAQAGGCLCERLSGGGSVEHMRVLFADTNKELRLAGGLGPLQTLAVSGNMVFRLRSADEGAEKEQPKPKTTTLEYSYLVSGNSMSALEPLAEPVDAVQLEQLLRLKNWIERRNPNWPALNKP